MPDKQFEILIHEVGHRDRNLKGIAAVMGIPYPTLAEQVNPDQIKKFGAGDLPLFIKAADDNRLIEYLCNQRDLVAVPISKRGESLDQKDLLNHLAGITRETGEASAVVAESLADGVIDSKERKKCLKEIEDAISALAKLRADLEADNSL